MLNTDLSINAATAVPAGTSNARTLALGAVGGGSSVRSDASVALTAPEILTVTHSKRNVKLQSAVAANDTITVLMDRHVLRLSKAKPATNALDPDYKSGLNVSLLIEVPIGPGIAVTSTNVSDAIKALVSMLTASADANLIRILNGEA